MDSALKYICVSKVSTCFFFVLLKINAWSHHSTLVGAAETIVELIEYTQFHTFVMFKKAFEVR